MQTVYSPPFITLIIIIAFLFVILAAVLIKLSRKIKNFKKKDAFAALLFIPIFSILFFLSITTTAKIAFASDSDISVKSGKLISAEMQPKSRNIEQAFLIVSLEGEAQKIQSIKISDVINPFSYTHNGKISVFNNIGAFYRISFVNDMIVKIEVDQ